MGDTLIMASGKKVKVASVTHDDYLHVVHCKVCEMTVAEVAILFSDGAETSTMTYGNTVYEGYTVIKTITPMSDWINVMMGRET